MTMRSLPSFRFTSIVLILSFCAISLADDKMLTADEALDGTWRADVSNSQTIIVSIKNSRIEMSAVSEEKRLPIWVGKLNISKDEPNHHMDWVELRVGNTKLPDNKCLYQLRGDVLLVIGGGPNQRPTRFLSGPGSDPKTLVFLRMTPEKEKAEHSTVPELPKKGS